MTFSAAGPSSPGKKSSKAVALLTALLIGGLTFTGCLDLQARRADVPARPLESIKDLILLTSDRSPEWGVQLSPDGRTMAFVARKHGNADIFIADAMGKNPLQVSLSTADDDNPSWLPDGRALVFDSDRLGYRAIFRVDLEEERVVHQVVARGASDFAAHVSPDGERIAFGAEGPAAESLWVAGIDGSEPAQIGEGIRPRWSPGGSRLLFTSSKAGNEDLWLVTLDGMRLVQLTVDSANDRAASWSPDGKKVVFASDRTGNFDIWTLDLESGTLTQLTNHPGDDDNPVWSPDGRHIYFDSLRGKNRDLWRLTPVVRS
jgi:Tol biopolymer transport system component